MPNFIFSERSLDRLAGVHSDLVAVAMLALELSPFDFGITEGVRSIERQKQLVEEKVSWTMNSRHISGHAIDIVVYSGGKVSWHGGHYLRVYEEAFKPAAAELEIPIQWGGHFKQVFDGPHYQLAWHAYPHAKPLSDDVCAT